MINKYSKLKYSIQEVVDLLEKNHSMIVEQSHLRFLEKEFNLSIERQNKRRMYSTTDINEILMILHLTKTKGMTLAGAKNKFNNEKTEVEKNLYLIQKLEKVKEKLQAIKKEIK